MRPPIHLNLALMLACAGFALPLPAWEWQATPAATPNQEVPSQDQPVPNQQPAQSAPLQTDSSAGQKASPPPKPPVLKHRKHKAAAHKTSSTNRKTAAKSSGDSGKVVVRNGGAKEGSAQLTPAMSPAQAKNQRANTASLLAATDANLKRVGGRQLTPAQQSMVDEIHTYMQQAKAAAASADTNRAQTLAYKARLLSDELARK